MDNPFLKRATEQFRRDPEAFLGVVSPQPLSYYLGNYAKDDTLYDRLVIIQGTPGSGKTTLAQLFEYPTLMAMLRNPVTFRDLISAMAKCQAVTDRLPRFIGCRLSLETDYRDFWEFDYPPDVKQGLMAALIQARAVQAWIHNFVAAGIGRERLVVIPREGTHAAAAAIGGTNVVDVERRAQDIEQSLYRVVASLVPPKLSALDRTTTEAYRPFDVIDSFRILPYLEGEEEACLVPLVILDDAHLLHPQQFERLRHWLARRELHVARWVMTRLDILRPDKALAAITEDRSERTPLPGITKDRDVIEILLQGGADGHDRSRQRQAFRRMARDMANRYLSQMGVFRDRNYGSLEDLLSPIPASLPPSSLKDLGAHSRTVQKRLRIADPERERLLAAIAAYKPGGVEMGEDVRLQLLVILMHRLARRPDQEVLFDVETQQAPEKPMREFKVDADLHEAAVLALHERYKRPYYYGMEDLCDAGSENAEQFLHLAAKLVEAIAVQLIRGKSASLDAATQDRLLVQRAEEIMRDWDFPQHRRVRTLIEYVAEQCRDQSLIQNAWNAPGPSAYGVLQAEFDQVTETNPDLASVLQFGVAYNAFRLVPRYSCKNREWCLLELGGLAVLSHGLSLRRSSFVEGKLADMASALAESRK